MAKEKKSKVLPMSELRQMLREKKDHEEGFAKLMEEQPKSAVEKCLGKKLPGDIKVHFVEDTLDTLFVVLPANPEKLTDEQLALVSGGMGDFWGEQFGFTMPEPVEDFQPPPQELRRSRSRGKR